MLMYLKLKKFECMTAIEVEGEKMNYLHAMRQWWGREKKKVGEIIND